LVLNCVCLDKLSILVLLKTSPKVLWCWWILSNFSWSLILRIIVHVLITKRVLIELYYFLYGLCPTYYHKVIGICYENISKSIAGYMRVRRGGQEGALAPPPWPAKNICFSTFFEDNSIFFGYFYRKIVFFCPPPWKILPSPGKKVCRRPWLGTGTDITNII